MTEQVDDPREFFVTVDATGIETNEYSFHVSEPVENPDADRRDVTVTFDIPKDEQRAAALAELYDYSVRVEEPPFEPEKVYETDTLRFLADKAHVGYLCVHHDEVGFAIIPPVEVVRVPIAAE